MDAGDELQGFQRQRDAAIVRRDELTADLERKLPEGTSLKDFNKQNIRDTLRNLGKQGVDEDTIEDLRLTAKKLSAARHEVTESTAHMGELGGQRYLSGLRDAGGGPRYEFPRVFDTHGATPGRGRVDGVVVRPDKSELVIAEYKGGGASLSSRQVDTSFEGKACQGTSAYARDRLIRDSRFQELFRQDPVLWEGVKTGRTSLTFKAIFTRHADAPPVVRDIAFDVSCPQARPVLDKLIRLVEGA